jgi:LysR family transcriptional regulator, glycine cleavage system transcriptional activator
MPDRSSAQNASQLPSTTALRVFLAAAAEGSTSRAAERVNLTQSAVSKQLLTLEAHVGAALFERSATGMKLSEAGELFVPYAEAALEQIAKGMRRLAERTQAVKPIRLHMLAIVGERWLMDRFPAFVTRHPDIDVQFTNYVSETAAEEPDLAIRHGPSPDDGRSTYLFGRHVSLVAAPSFIDRLGAFKEPADVQRMAYLQHFQTPGFWAEFTEAAGLRGAVPARTTRYGYHSVIIKAAVSGLGIALLPTCFVREELTDGRLVNPLNLAFKSASGCWLTCTNAQPKPPGIALLADWLIEEARRFEEDR